MNPSLRNQLRGLDRALLGLLDERARMLSDVASADPARAPAVDDMLRRHDGPFPPAGVSEVFAVIERECRTFARDEDPHAKPEGAGRGPEDPARSEIARKKRSKP